MSLKVKSKIKVKKAQSDSGSDDGSDHELFYYANNRVQLMKEVLKLLKPKKIKTIAPDFMKNLDIEEINSMLLEELLGISNKRLRNILNGVNVDESSSESEEDKEPIDIISLDDISDIEDFNSDVNDRQNSKKSGKKNKHVKTEKVNEKEKLMSVLEILELQARARAIRSQLALENQQKNKEGENTTKVETDDSDIEEIIVQDSKEVVVIDSENENIEDSNKEETSKEICVKELNENCNSDKTDCKTDKIAEISSQSQINEDNGDTVVINLDSVEIEEMHT